MHGGRSACPAGAGGSSGSLLRREGLPWRSILCSGGWKVLEDVDKAFVDVDLLLGEIDPD